MTDITKEMRRIIEENLPAATAGAMKDFITQSEINDGRLKQAHEECETLAKKNETAQKENDGFAARVKELEKRVLTETELTSRKLKVEEGERGLELRIAEIKLQGANDRNSKIEQLVEKVFGHPTVTVSRSKTVPIMVNQGEGCAPYQSGSESHFEDEITKKSKE